MNTKWSEKYRAASICVFAALVMLIGGLFASQKGSSAKLIGRLPDPQSAAQEFFELYRRGEYEALDRYIYGYETIGLSGEPESDYGKRMLGYLRSELVYDVSGEPEIDGNRAVVDVNVKYFCVPDTVDDLKQLVNDEIISNMKEDSEGIDLTVHNEEYYNGIVLPSLESAVDKLMENKEQYMRSGKLRLEMVYDRSGWKIVPSDDLEKILLGGMS